MKPRVWIDKEIPPEMRGELTELLERWKFLIPSWVWYLKMYDSASKEGAALSNEAEVPYRKAYLYIRPDFYTYHKDERERFFVHELVHIALGEITQWTENLLMGMIEDETVRNHLRRETMWRLEGTVEELQNAMVLFREEATNKGEVM